MWNAPCPPQYSVDGRHSTDLPSGWQTHTGLLWFLTGIRGSQSSGPQEMALYPFPTLLQPIKPQGKEEHACCIRPLRLLDQERPTVSSWGNLQRTLHPWSSTRGNSALHGSGDISGCYIWGRRGLWHQVSRVQRCCQTSCNTKNSPRQQRIIQPTMSTVPRPRRHRHFRVS